jgi:hypothetical protein
MSPALKLATAVVRTWTRVYTVGLAPAERTARRAEIDSDLWELEHDPEAQRGWVAAHVLVRLVAGIPDDLAWRMEAGASPSGVPMRALAAAGMPTGPRRVSALSLSAAVHVIGISLVVWLTSHGFLYWRHPGAVVPEQAELWPQLQTFEVSVEVVPTPGPSSPLTPPNRFITTLLQNRYALEVGKGYVFGPGAPVLQAAFRQSHFVLLGDDRDLGRIAELGRAMCGTTLQACDGVLMNVDALQVYRGVNPAGARGTGADIAIRAERQGLQSLHIRVVVDDASQAPRALQLFLDRRLESTWTLFDLRPLRQNFNVVAGRGNIDLATLVFGIDLLVVVPEGTPSAQVR